MPEFDTEEERLAFALGMETAAKELQKPPLTIDEIRQMTPQQIIARKREVDAVLSAPKKVVNNDD